MRGRRLIRTLDYRYGSAQRSMSGCNIHVIKPGGNMSSYHYIMELQNCYCMKEAIIQHLGIINKMIVHCGRSDRQWSVWTNIIKKVFNLTNLSSNTYIIIDIIVH